MSDTKKRVSVNICGNLLTLITDESEDFVSLIADTLTNKMRALTKNNFRVSNIDAALLCALDETSDRLKAEKKLRNLEVKIDLYEAEIASLKAELDKKASPTEESDGENTSPANTISRDISDTSGASTREEKIKALENYLLTNKNSISVTSKKEREEKSRYIEALLRDHEKHFARAEQIDLFDTTGA